MLASRTILPRVARCAALPASRMPFSSSRVLSHKESSSNDDVDKHKLDSLRKQKDSAGHWKRELASDSEEAVKADKGHGAASESVEQLQERTKKMAEESKKSGTSSHEGM
ncbi:Mitochondrial carrier protein PET8 [Akanthomyces lecanii RCEF 1005]|uniref:Mitochondrial carrier protein PET8 n=1 Tax=Akanthomyces lecanii RCEF 1005 TaxID=1081108 RepID=A0A168IZB5_CORDF|nr:Mitochondrial carrier protein PET8 [Akanthomyces lecanii RCEF 1005]